VESHGEDLRLALVKQNESETEEAIKNLVDEIKRDYTEAKLNSKDRIMLDFSLKLTQKAWESQQKDIDQLKSAGFSEEQIVEIVHIASYFNYINRVVDGLGGELEEWMKNK
jgi:uncharacterized peroxidase-related enzyme